VVSAIGPGLLVLVGVHETDTDSDADYMYEPTSPS
jgi:D-tyrosyl-tRNA(Tyr) deacylase